MLDDNPVDDSTPTPDHTPGAGDAPVKKAVKKATVKKVAAKKAPAAKKAVAKKTTAKKAASADPAPEAAPGEPAVAAPAKKTAAKRAPAKKAATRKTATTKETAEVAPDAAAAQVPESAAGEPSAPGVLFQAPDTASTPARRTRKKAVADPAAPEPTPAAGETAEQTPAPVAKKKSQPRKKAAPTADEPEMSGASAPAGEPDTARDASRSHDDDDNDDDNEGGTGRRRRRRGGRRRRKSGDNDSNDAGGAQHNGADGQSGGKGSDRASDKASDKTSDRGGDKGGDSDSDEPGGDGSSRRRRRRRRSGDDGDGGSDDPENTTTRVRRTRNAEDEITAISGSTRLEAKKQRRRDGREAGRRRAPIVSEAEFLARREAVERVMVIRQREDLTQIAVLEDKVLVEHYVARESQTSIIGNVYLGRVQNVLPSMEAAFIDIGKGRNAVLYAGEVNWSALGHKDGAPRKIESVLSSGQPILVQVTKDPIGHKGARLTSQVSLAGRFLVYVPDGTTSGISRKLPDTERTRLKSLLKEIVPDTAGVIVRTAAEGASEDELTRDVERLKARWEDIEGKVKGNAPQLLYGEPDLTLKVVRDLFTEDFAKLVIEGDDAWDTVQGYVSHVAPDLEERLERYDRSAHNGKDSFGAFRVDEQIAKGLDRKVWLPSGGSLIIDRTEAMTVVDVNTGKFTGSGGNLEETVTKNNLEAAEEMVRQLRLRDIGGIIVIDFIDMVLESNRDLVLRRLVECLGRDRTRHQVAEVTSLGLVQMTRKRIGTGLVESFSENCQHCQGRGVVIQDAPVDPGKSSNDDDGRSRGGRRGRGGRSGQNGDDQGKNDQGKNDQGKGEKQRDRGREDSEPQVSNSAVPSPSYVASVARPENAEKAESAAKTEVAEQPSASGADAEPAKAPPAAEAGSATEKPQVVTRTRRRSASRPTTTVPASEPATVSATGPAAGPEAGPEPTPVVVTEPAQAAAPVSPPEPPKVITRTRGRSARRPAGPPVDAPEQSSEAPRTLNSVGAPPATGAVEPGTADHEPGDAGDVNPVGHVPVKKKGSRKR